MKLNASSVRQDRTLHARAIRHYVSLHSPPPPPMHALSFPSTSMPGLSSRVAMYDGPLSLSISTVTSLLPLAYRTAAAPLNTLLSPFSFGRAATVGDPSTSPIAARWLGPIPGSFWLGRRPTGAKRQTSVVQSSIFCQTNTTLLIPGLF